MTMGIHLDYTYQPCHVSCSKSTWLLKVASDDADVQQPDVQAQYTVKDSWHIRYYKWGLNCHKVLQIPKSQLCVFE